MVKSSRIFNPQQSCHPYLCLSFTPLLNVAVCPLLVLTPFGSYLLIV